MGIVREISPELDPVEFPDNMDEAAVDAFMAQRGRELRQGLISRRQAQLAAETEGDEALRYASGEMPLSERVISTVMSAPQSAMRQTGQTLRGLGEFLATAPIPRERGEIAPEIVRENIRRAQRPREQVEREVEASPTRRLGGEMVAAAPEAFPTLPGVRESLPSQVSGGIGSVGALLPAGLTGPAAPFVGGAMYGLSAGEDFADDAEQVINSRIAEALAQGNTDLAADLERRKFDMKNTARMAGRVIGAGTEGVLGLAGKIRVGKSQIGGIGARLAERMVPKSAPVAVQNAVRGAIEGGLTEAAQEGTEQILGNAAALAVYDPNRGIMDDVAQSVLVGGLTGKVVGGAFGSRGQNRDPLPASRAAAAGEVVPGTEIPQDIGAPDLTLEDLGDLLPVEAGPEAVSQPGTPVTATQETTENMGILQETPVPEAGPEPAPETPAVDSPTLSPATAAETPTAPETPASPAPSSSAEGVTGEKPKRTRKAKRVAGVEAAGAPAPTPAIPPDDTAMEAATAAAMAPGAPATVTTAPDEGIAERAAVDDEMTRATTRVPEVAAAQVGMPDEGVAPAQMAQTNPEPEAQSLTPKQYHKAINAWRAKEYGVPVSEVEENYSEESNKQDHWSAVNKFVERGGKLDSKILDSLDEDQIQYLQRSARASIPEGYLSPAVRAKNKAFEREMIDARKRGREEAKRVVPTLTESQRRYEAVKAKLDALGPEPRKPSNERQRFGTQGRAKASPEAVARYDAEVKAYKNWRAKYSRLKKAEVAASNKVYREDPGYFDRKRAAAAATPEPTITEAPAAQAAEQQPDILERALNAAIKATDRTSATFSDPFLIAAVGLPVLNAALRIVRRVYLKTRDLARAKRQGMRLIRRQLRTDPKADLPRIEEAFNQLVEGTAEKPGPDQIEAFQAADGTRRQKSRGLFTGDVTVDTDAEWQAGAERWIAQFNGNIRRAFEAARSTDYATTGLNPAAQNYVFGRLLEMSEIAINAARNDVDALRAINLQKEITDASRLASSEAGKALGARALVQNRLLWMFPVLNYRNLIREAQKRLPFPDVVADEVRTWLQESGRRAVQEMRNAMTDADKVFARELKTTVRDMRVVWRDVMTASVESQEAMRRKILEELVKAPELKGLSRQGYIDIANLLGKAWERERARIFAAEFRKQVPLPTVKEDVRRKLFTAIPDILKWANLGLLDNEAFRNAVAPKFGVAKFDGETAKKLNTMAQQAQRVGGVNRNRIIAEMYDTMQREGGVRWPDIVRDYWYAAVLGAVNTQVDNALGVINGALNTVMGMAMSPPEVRKAMGKAYKEGFGEAIADFFPILWRGDVARAINFNPEQPANTLNALSKSGNLFARGLSVGKYVSRLMTALDQINALSTDQAMKAYALGRRLPIEHVRRYMMPSENVLRTARLKAEAEGTPPNLMRKRVREIVQESIPVEVLISSKDIRELVTFTNQPKGLMGALYRGVQEMEKKAPGFKVLSGTNFLRFAANYSNEILNYVAPVALYRYYVSAPSRADGRLGLKMGQEERQLILAKLAVGTALGTFAAALFLGDDDDEKDRKIDITGSFKSLDPNKRKQLLGENRAPYSIRIGDKYVSYRQLPFGGVLGAIGELRDRQLYNPKEWNQESIARKFVDGAFAGSLIVRDSPAISSFTEFLGTANAYKYDMNEQVEKSLPKYIARLGGSFIPRIAKEIDAWADPAIYKANTGHEFFLQQMPIFRRELGEGPVLNVLGEPVQVERYPWSRWIKTRKEDKAWSTLGELASKGVFMPVPSVTVKVLDNGKRREMTPAESYRYQQRVGQAYRKFVEDNSERLLRMKPDEATDFIDAQTERIRSRIRAGGA